MGKDDSLVYQKAFSLTINMVKLYRLPQDSKRQLILSKQILRSGTGIAANIREALEGQSGGFYRKTLDCPKRSCLNRIMA